jgi:acetyl-CoA carboxylase biotin carboxyl carrier protein
VEWKNVNEAKLRRLIAIFKDSGVEEMEYSESFWRGMRLRLNRARTSGGYQTTPSADFHAATPSPAHASPEPSAPVEAAAPVVETTEEDLHIVPSPMVGTFYRAPSPDAEAFVSEGESIAVGRTLCVIEAMKIMNEIEADIAGVVVEVLVANGDPVEYNQPLLKLRPV